MGVHAGVGLGREPARGQRDARGETVTDGQRYGRRVRTIFVGVLGEYGPPCGMLDEYEAPSISLIQAKETLAAQCTT
jgi:hypothetical protein